MRLKNRIFTGNRQKARRSPPYPCERRALPSGRVARPICLICTIYTQACELFSQGVRFAFAMGAFAMNELDNSKILIASTRQNIARTRVVIDEARLTIDGSRRILEEARQLLQRATEQLTRSRTLDADTEAAF